MVVNIAASFIITADSLSILATGIVLITILLDSPVRNRSYNLKLIFRLLLSDFCLSSMILIYYGIQISNGVNLTTACSICLPILMYFFVSSFVWTVMIAVRFAYTNEKKIYVPKIPLWSVWLIPFVLLIPTIVLNAKGNLVLSVEEDDTVLACTYNHAYKPAVIVDIITIQVPLVITIILNILAYIKGYKALRNSPQSVTARYMRRAGGYLLVLVVVWFPTIAFNIMSRIVNSNQEFLFLFNGVVFLLCSQGFLNVGVYIWSHHKMKRWLLEAFCIYKLMNCCKATDPLKQSQDESSVNDDDIEDIDEEDGDQSESKLSKGFSNSTISKIDNNNNHIYNDSFNKSRSSFQRYQNRHNNNEDSSDLNDFKLKSSFYNKQKTTNPIVTIQDLDSEKYVRFGG